MDEVEDVFGRASAQATSIHKHIQDLLDSTDNISTVIYSPSTYTQPPTKPNYQNGRTSHQAYGAKVCFLSYRVHDHSTDTTQRAPSKAIPVVVAATSAALVITYVRSQLARNSRIMDERFAQYNTPESEAARRKMYTEAGKGGEDPRTSAFNVLGW